MPATASSIATPARPFAPEGLPRKLRHLVARGSQLVKQSDPELLYPISAPFGRPLTGGLQRGSLVEITGRQTSGRFSLALSILATTTSSGDVAALIDLGNSLDPRNARDLGIDLDRLLWLRPKHLKPALIATEIAIQTGFPLVIFDLGEPPVRGGRGNEASWLRLTRGAAARQSLVIVSSPYRVSGTAANTVFETKRAEPRWRGGNRAPCLLEAMRFNLNLQKAQKQSTNQDLSFVLTSPSAYLGERSEKNVLHPSQQTM